MKRIFLTTAIATASLCAAAQVNSPATDGYSRRATLMFEDRNYVGCIDQMTRLKSMSPTPAETEEADYYIALSAARLGQADAIPLLKYFLWRYPASPRCPIVRLNVANLIFDAGEYGDAYSLYEKIDTGALDSSAAEQLRYNMGYCLLKRAEYDRAETLFASLSGSHKYGNGARFYQGYIAYINKDYRKAADIFRKLDTSTAPANMADYYLAQIYFNDRDYSRASTTARRLMTLDVDPSFKAEAARIAGESQYQLGNDDEAVKLLDQYVAQVESPVPSALYILGVAAYRNGDYSGAIGHLTPVSELDNAMGQSAYLFIGQAMMQQANYSSAMIAFDKAYRMDHDADLKETALYNYAVAKTEGGKIPFGNSVATFEDFLRNFPTSRHAESVREYLVTGYMTDNNYPAALASIESITNPSDKILKAKQQVLYTLGSRELAAGQTQAAIDHLRQARALRRHDAAIGAETDLWLGEALYASGKYTEAAQSLTEAINNRALSADNRPLALYDLAYARFSDGKYDEALTDFNNFLTSSANSSARTIADAYNRVGDCHYYNSRFTEASEAYQKAYSVDPSTGDYALFQGALMKGLTHDREGKIEGLRSMIQRFPSSGLVPSALLEMGETYDILNRPDKTIETYSMLAARYPDTPQGRQANLLMALTYVNNGNTQQAIDTYRNLISAAPTSDEARQASEKLKDLMADEGRLNEYAEFINSIPGAAHVAGNELEATAFRSAERDYLSNGTTARLLEYLRSYPDGASRVEALAYMIKANSISGDNAATLTYAEELIADYPASSHIPEALKAKADILYAQGKGEQALETYTRLEETAPSPYIVNDARLGIIRTARDLNLNDRVLATAEALVASSTISPEQRSEALFAKALALDIDGDHTEAAAIWRQMASDTDDIYGAKAAFYLAQQEFDAGETDKALKDVEALIDSDTPHNYWLARGFILLSDINAARGNRFEAEQYLISLRDNYPGSESDIFNMIEQRLQK